MKKKKKKNSQKLAPKEKHGLTPVWTKTVLRTRCFLYSQKCRSVNAIGLTMKLPPKEVIWSEAYGKAFIRVTQILRNHS